MKFNILITAFPFVNEYKKLRKLFKKHNFNIKVIKTSQYLKEKDLIKVVENIDGILCGDDEINENVLKKANKLKVLSKWGTGIDSIDLETCKKLKIKVFNTPGAFTESVATQALAFILNFNRKILENDNNIKKGIWNKFEGVTLVGKKIGIIGLGNIGLRIAELLLPFKSKIFGNDIKKINNKKLKKLKVNIKSKNYIYKNCDIIIIATDLNTSTRYLINKKTLKLIRKKPLLVNIARGPIINDQALILLLEKKIIAGACLDVFEKEPLPLKSKLRKFKNVIFTSHNAFNTVEEVNKVHFNTYKNLVLGLKK
ncbi:NAD(P)-dependent oxidoreductase [Candidatus Pelagibacter sp. HIMB1483]|uniref:NAD(P)-dependent oxidoreductase n=1 Tax=Candidatus Pelagibacter sp. HIMB1483 TaxID=3415414 RepID=UPI003F825982